MYMTKKIAYRRDAFTLIEMMVVIAIILAVAALAAAFAPRVNDNQKMTRAVDNLEQWLLTAKMRAKRDGLSTGLRFVQTQGDINIDPSLKLIPPGPPTIFSQFQYIQQPEPLTGGVCLGQSPGPGAYPYTNPTTGVTNNYTGGLLVSAGGGFVSFVGVDFTLGGTVGLAQFLVAPGDYLEVNGGGSYQIASANTNKIQLVNSAYALALKIDQPTTNYRILRQPRILIGEEPLALPDNYAANFGPLPGYLPATSGCNVAPGANGINPEILFSPSGAVVGNNAGSTLLVISVWDVPAQIELPDPNRVGVVGIQTRSGFIGAYGLSLGTSGPWYFVQSARESGL